VCYVWFITHCVFLFCLNIKFRYGDFMKKCLLYFHGVKKEIKRVRWPNREYMVKYSIAVILFGVFFSALFSLIDFLFAILKVWLR
jgi:preprotein translocase SecE subunit